MARRKPQRGSAMMEFCLAGVASATVLISTFQLGMGMWKYHTLAYAVHEATRYAAVRGVGCTKPGNTCSVTLGTLSQQIKTLSIGVPSDEVNVTFTTDSGAATPCNPLSSCFTSTTVWPPATNLDNRKGKFITISAAYQFRSALLILWPGQSAQQFGTIWLPASSTQTIVF